MENLSIACDFDGTITCRDTLHLIVESFGEPGAWGAIEPRLQSGEITLEAAMQEQFAGVRATPGQVADLVRARAGLRPGFGELVAWARHGGHRLVVLSSGFRGVISLLLDDWGFGDLEVTCHDAVFSAAGARLVWSDRGAPCADCGRPCKRHDIRRLGLGRPLAYIGDGISDRCAAGLADRVFARADLARHLAADGVPFTRFDDFHQVRRHLAAAEGLAA